jgi:type IV secretory pathway VirB2 component (pilin)
MQMNLKSLKEKISLKCLYVGISGLTFPSIVLADTSTDNISKLLQGLISLLSGGWARFVFVLVIIGALYGLMSGKIKKRTALTVCLGVFLIFLMAHIAILIGGTSYV